MNGKRAALLSVAGVIAIGGAGLATAGLGGGGEAPLAHSSLPPATAPIERTTLVETQTVGGTLGYGTTSTATSGGGGGVLTWLPGPGAVITRGRAAYRVDNEPVPLLYGSLPLYRTLSAGTEGPDVKQFERNLRALGYTGFTVDDTYSSATAAAVRRWQDDLGVDETGRVVPGSVLIAPRAIRVAERKANVGDRAGGPVFTHTGTTRVVSVDLDVTYQKLAKKGAEVSIELTEDETTKGKITKIGKVAKEGQGEEDPTTIEVTIAVRRQRALGTYDKAPVNVNLTANRKPDVLAVPIGALVAQPGGGYGVQVVSGGSVRTVRVETGLFTEGQVEISGSGLAEGQRVGVPA
ncbi:peptidoglycan-binding protein [Actinomadura sp. HBU206391]|uniref:peptidoglycan-binding protein n=1 Tax=Actinomadura sp. HBU206391 TaxID=2731692 RepID=UPI001650B0CC|nr:peptidoglycan-binding protein [Actinomadura sp. HBU206391]MBC6458903.1 peptidoglycan-binding protein [Actinomadura sp. HBU206391]